MNRVPKMYWWLLGLSTLVAFIPVFVPALDIAVSGYYLLAKPSRPEAHWLWVEWVNEYIPILFRTLLAICVLATAVTWRNKRWKPYALPILFVALALLAGPGLLANGLKDLTLRARPFHVSLFSGDRNFSPALQMARECDENCAFVSGHTADGIFLATFILIDRRRRRWWLAAGVAGGLLIGFARIAVGAHWLSDVLWAFPVTLLASLVVWLAMQWFWPGKVTLPDTLTER